MTSLLGISDSLSGITSPIVPNAIKPLAPAPASIEQERADLRAFGDSPATRQLIFENVLNAAKKLPVLENARHSLELQNPAYMGPERYSIRDRKRAILEGKTLARKLRGDWVLRDKATGDELDRKSTTIANVPYLTDGGTFVHNGNEYTLGNQLRLRPGSFTRIKDNGEVESHANIMPGKGRSHRYFIDPEKGVFYARVAQAKIPLISLLRVLGVQDEQLRDAWGPELFATNSRLYSDADAEKFYQRLVARKPADADKHTRHQLLREAFDNMEIDPDVAQKTLGVPHKRLDLPAILDTTRKLLAVSRGEADVDDRDHLAYQTIYGPEDLFAERIAKDYGNTRRTMFNRASWMRNLSKFQPGMLTKQLESALLHSGLGQNLEEINSADVFDKQFRVSRMGEGGIPCHSADTQVLTKQGWKPWGLVGIEDELACLFEGELVFRRPRQLHKAVYSGEMLRGVTEQLDYLVTPDHRMFVRSSTSGKGTWTARSFRTAREIHGKKVKHLVACDGYLGGTSRKSIHIEPAPVGGSNRGSATKVGVEFPFLPWVRFVGYYLADGSTTYVPKRKEYRIEIGKVKKKNPKEWRAIDSTLKELGVSYRYEQGRRFVISGKHLAWYTKKFGKASVKFVPNYVLEGDWAVREEFFEAITLCDNSIRRSGYLKYASASKTLRDHVAWLAISLGKSVRYSTIEKKKEKPQYVAVIRDKVETGISLQKRKTQYQKVKYSGMVYCAEVPGGLLCTRRNGKVFWSGNSVDAVPDEARSVQPSHFGYLDPIRTPESFRVGVDVFISGKSKKGRDGRLYSPFTDTKTGKTVWRSPQDVADIAVAFPGEMSRDSKRVFAMQGGRIRAVPRSSVALTMDNFENAFSPLGNMIPLKSMVKGQRMAMASRMLTQALPLINPEAPLVQSGAGNDQLSYEEEYGRHMGALRATKPGRVMSVDDDGITVRYHDGTTETHELYNNFPYNRKTYIHQTPVVKPGTSFDAGTLLARSNYTDEKGVTALGKNARVAYIPFRGMNFEDAIVISQGFADKLSSEHLYQHRAEFDKDHKRSKPEFMSLFPGKYNREQLETIGDNGAVAVGTVVNYGDPLILAAAPKAFGKHKVHRKKSRMFDDQSVTWNHHTPGVVTDVVEGKNGTTALVKSIVPMQVGDKLCFDPETSLLTRNGYKPVAEITEQDQLATLDPETGEMVWRPPDRLHAYHHEGKMYRLKTKHLDMLVTLNHKLWVRQRGKENYQFIEAEKLFESDKRWFFQKDMKWRGKERTEFNGDPDYVPRSSRENTFNQVPMDLWLEFCGYYVAEGRTCQTSSGGMQVQISQFPDSEAFESITDCLNSLGLRYQYLDAEHRFIINSKYLCQLLEPFGSNAYDKKIPDYVQELSSRQLGIFFDAYMAGDGHKGKCWEYGTSSKQLSADLELVLLKLGWCGRVVEDNRTEKFTYGDEYRPHWRTRVNRRHLRPVVSKRMFTEYEANEQELVDYSGMVYCVTVPNHLVYAKRGGKSYWSGNSGRYG